MLTKYIDKFNGMFIYHSKDHLISDICQELQSTKKSLGSCRATLLHQTMVLKHPYLAFPNEKWTFDIIVRDNEFVICKCLLTDLNRNTTIAYFGEELKFSRNDDTYNKCRNITEFRTFLKFEVGKYIPA